MRDRADTDPGPGEPAKSGDDLVIEELAAGHVEALAKTAEQAGGGEPRQGESTDSSPAAEAAQPTPAPQPGNSFAAVARSADESLGAQAAVSQTPEASVLPAILVQLVAVAIGAAISGLLCWLLSG